MNTARLKSLTKTTREIIKLYSVKDYPAIILRAIRLYRDGIFFPKEAFRLGLYNPALPMSEVAQYTSKRRLMQIQNAINPQEFRPTVRHKSVFYYHCAVLQVPIPQLYAIFFKGMGGWSYNGAILGDRANWKKFLEEDIPAEFVIKPSKGGLGQGVNAYTRANGTFVDVSEKSYTAAMLYDRMVSDPQFDSFVVQERLKNHPDLARFSNTDSLQTIRATTFVDWHGQVHILHAKLKIIVGNDVVDNFRSGTAQNVSAEICQSDGTLQPAVTIGLNEPGVQNVFSHPETGLTIEGFQLPFWPETCNLIKDVALKFLPLRTIGWDVAITPKGPYIIEGNVNWDPTNEHQNMGDVLDMMSKLNGNSDFLKV